MRQSRQKPGTKSAVHILKRPFPDVTAFNAVIFSLITKNPLGCTAYRTKKKNNPPVSSVREMYTTTFAYEDAMQK